MNWNAKAYENTRETLFYVYLIKHSLSGMVYYGKRISEFAHPCDLFVTYFTSSDLVHSLLERDGIESFEFEIRRIFTDKTKCSKWEKRVLEYFDVENNPRFLNLDSKQRSDKPIQCNVKVRSISNLSSGKSIRYPVYKPIPDGWIKGNINAPKVSCTSGTKWFHNLSTGKAVMIKKGMEVPPGFLSGRGSSYVSNSSTLKNKKSRWISNGEISKLITAGESVPEGFKEGRLATASLIPVSCVTCRTQTFTSALPAHIKRSKKIPHHH